MITVLLRDLRFPPPADDTVLLYLTGEIVTRVEQDPTELQWHELSGPGVPRTVEGFPAPTSQPFVGCLTGGDRVAHRLMMFLAEG